MSEKIETSTYFFDEKNAGYYKNRALNNCKMRSKYLIKLQNQINNCLNTLEYLKNLEDTKDHNYTEITEIYDVYNTLKDINSEIESISIMLSEENTKILSTNFEEIINQNIEKIRDVESSKNNNEIYIKEEQ